VGARAACGLEFRAGSTGQEGGEKERGFGRLQLNAKKWGSGVGSVKAEGEKRSKMFKG